MGNNRERLSRKNVIAGYQKGKSDRVDLEKAIDPPMNTDRMHFVNVDSIAFCVNRIDYPTIGGK